jgi:hypothetical protein
MNAGSSRKDCLSFLLLCVDFVVVVLAAGWLWRPAGHDVSGVRPATTTTSSSATRGEHRHSGGRGEKCNGKRHRRDESGQWLRHATLLL